MNYCYSKKALVSLCLLTALSSNNIRSMSALRSTMKTIAPSIASRVSTFAIPATLLAGAGIAMSLKALATRYLTLGALQASISPTLTLDATPDDRSVYNWNLDTEHFRTISDVNGHQQEVRDALVQACISGTVDIYKHDRLNEKQAQGSISWQDVSATLQKEQQHLDDLKKKLESYVDLSCNIFHRRIHLFGVKRNYQAACASLGITKAERMSQAQETYLNATMMQNRGRCERAIAFLMLNPNYDKAHKIYWQVHQRQTRLQAISAAVANTGYEQRALITQPTMTKKVN